MRIRSFTGPFGAVVARFGHSSRRGSTRHGQLGMQNFSRGSSGRSEAVSDVCIVGLQTGPIGPLIARFIRYR